MPKIDILGGGHIDSGFLGLWEKSALVLLSEVFELLVYLLLSLIELLVFSIFFIKVYLSLVELLEVFGKLLRGFFGLRYFGACLFDLALTGF